MRTEQTRMSPQQLAAAIAKVEAEERLRWKTVMSHPLATAEQRPMCCHLLGGSDMTAEAIIEVLRHVPREETPAPTVQDQFAAGAAAGAKAMGLAEVPQLDPSLIPFSEPQFVVDSDELRRGQEAAQSLISRGYGECSRHRSDAVAAQVATSTLGESYANRPDDLERAGREMAAHLKKMAGGITHD